MPRQVEHLDGEPGPKLENLAALHSQIDRDALPHRVAQPRFRRRIVIRLRSVHGIPTVAFAQNPLPVLDPARILLVRTEDRRRRNLPDRRVPPEVIDVRVTDQDVVERRRIEPHPREVGQNHLLRRRNDPRIDEQRPLPHSRYCENGRGPSTLSIR